MYIELLISVAPCTSCDTRIGSLGPPYGTRLLSFFFFGPSSLPPPSRCHRCIPVRVHIGPWLKRVGTKAGGSAPCTTQSGGSGARGGWGKVACTQSALLFLFAFSRHLRAATCDVSPFFVFTRVTSARCPALLSLLSPLPHISTAPHTTTASEYTHRMHDGEGARWAGASSVCQCTRQLLHASGVLFTAVRFPMDGRPTSISPRSGIGSGKRQTQAKRSSKEKKTKPTTTTSGAGRRRAC